MGLQPHGLALENRPAFTADRDEWTCEPFGNMSRSSFGNAAAQRAIEFLVARMTGALPSIVNTVASVASAASASSIWRARRDGTSSPRTNTLTGHRHQRPVAFWQCGEQAARSGTPVLHRKSLIESRYWHRNRLYAGDASSLQLGTARSLAAITCVSRQHKSSVSQNQSSSS